MDENIASQGLLEKGTLKLSFPCETQRATAALQRIGRLLTTRKVSECPARKQPDIVRCTLSQVF